MVLAMAFTLQIAQNQNVFHAKLTLDENFVYESISSYMLKDKHTI